MTVRWASAFTGVAGFEVGARAAGVGEPTVMIERDKAKQRALKAHYPNVPLMGDIQDVQGSDLGRIDVLAGGFPCKNTSIGAPHRLGLAGEHSKHFWDFLRLLDEYKRLISATNPRVVLIENTPGLLASPGVCTRRSPCYKGCTCGVDKTGWDMAAVARCLEELGYGWAYRVVDGRHLGTGRRRTVQQRPRVLVVGHLGDDAGPARQILGLTDSGKGADRANQVGRRPRGPVAAGVATPSGQVVWRKSARPRASLAKGGYETWVADGRANVLTGFDTGLATRQTHLVGSDKRIRTLTTLEWERLMGFDDDWTAPMGGVSAREAALGDALHTGTSEWWWRGVKRTLDSLPLLRRPA